MKKDNYTFHINGQANFADNGGIIHASQNNNGISTAELDKIISSLKEYLIQLDEDSAGQIEDTIAMMREELNCPKPSRHRLQTCITLFNGYLVAANGIPELASNIHKVINYIQSIL